MDNTNRLCSRWLKKGKSTNTFRCIICNLEDLSCANGGWTDVKKHSERPKHIQRMKDVFSSISLVVSDHPPSSLSNNINNGDVSSTVATSTDVNAKLTALKNQLIENSENLNRLRKKTEKIND